MGIETNPHSSRNPELADFPRRRSKAIGGIFGIDPALDAVTLDSYIFLPITKRCAPRHADLFLHQIDAGDHLGDRMFDLNPGIHLDEVKTTIGIEEELDGPCPTVICGHGQIDGTLTHPSSKIIIDCR